MKWGIWAVCAASCQSHIFVFCQAAWPYRASRPFQDFQQGRNSVGCIWQERFHLYPPADHFGVYSFLYVPPLLLRVFSPAFPCPCTSSGSSGVDAFPACGARTVRPFRRVYGFPALGKFGWYPASNPYALGIFTGTRPVIPCSHCHCLPFIWQGE